MDSQYLLQRTFQVGTRELYVCEELLLYVDPSLCPRSPYTILGTLQKDAVCVDCTLKLLSELLWLSASDWEAKDDKISSKAGADLAMFRLNIEYQASYMSAQIPTSCAIRAQDQQKKP